GSCATEKYTIKIWPKVTCDGSNFTSTDSVCPVSPLLTISYPGEFTCPPEYPATTDFTPFTCSKTACTPQKHPPPRTTLSVPFFSAIGASTAGFGNGNFGSLGPAPMERTACHPKNAMIAAIANPRPIHGLRMAHLPTARTRPLAVPKIVRTVLL